MKTLYFEGAGCVPRGEVENCRIRTAFRNKNGEPIYLEMSGNDKAYRFKTDDKGNRKAIELNGAFGWINHCFNIDKYLSEEKEDNVRMSFENAEPDVNYEFEYTKAEILRFVNEKLDGDFDEVVVLPDLAGYRVHKGGGSFNFGDEFIYNEERTEQAERIRQYYYDKEKERGVKFPCFSIWFDEGENLKVRFFDGRGTVNIPDVFAFEYA